MHGVLRMEMSLKDLLEKYLFNENIKGLLLFFLFI
jgi:hypothetical protein